MGYAQFLQALFSDGRLLVDALETIPTDELTQGLVVMQEFEQFYRMDFPGEPPEFDELAATWAGTNFYHACQFVTYRELGEELLHKQLLKTFHGEKSPSVHYSVDLVFRLLPDLYRLARSASEHDPLLEYLQLWGTDWPLSSVNMKLNSPVTPNSPLNIDKLLAHDGLMKLYAERVISHQATERAEHPQVKQIIERMAGPHEKLLEQVSSLLKPDTISTAIVKVIE